ncbi:MAG: L-threonylcarbamoyladenylate synthase [Huintestinicola sp.]
MYQDTIMLTVNDPDIMKAAELLRSGEVVGIPTETVYGLAADALDENAVRKIFEAKGRPQDNPLIVHIADLSDIYKYAENIPENALKLAEEFWPGPLTMVLKKKDIIPYVTSGGLDTVGLRFPAHPAAQKIIRACGKPLAAPSANLSGSPSPTTAKHVMADMMGRIPAVVDGGCCHVGVESTVVSFDESGRVCLLRPGFISLEDLSDAVGEDNVFCAHGVTEKVGENERVLSPGMKYKHYSPKANIIIAEGSAEALAELMREKHSTAVVFSGDEKYFTTPCITYGASSEEQARNLFNTLRFLDEQGIKEAYFRCPEKTGVGLAVYNRLLRAAGFEVIRL